MSVTLGSSGVSLTGGKKILNADYDLQVDARPEEITQEFLDEYDRVLDDVDDEWGQVVEDARKFAVDTITHIEALARQEGVPDSSPLEEERVAAQLEDGVLKMSNVWEGAWRDIRAGTCQERAITLHALYNEMGIESRYHEGKLELDNGTYTGHCWTTVEDEYISDPSVSGDGVIQMDDAERYKERKIYVR